MVRYAPSNAINLLRTRESDERAAPKPLHRAMGGNRSQAAETEGSPLRVGAHWYIQDAAVTISTSPRTIHDFGGFPRELYQVIADGPASSPPKDHPAGPPLAKFFLLTACIQPNLIYDHKSNTTCGLL